MQLTAEQLDRVAELKANPVKGRGYGEDATTVGDVQLDTLDLTARNVTADAEVVEWPETFFHALPRAVALKLKWSPHDGEQFYGNWVRAFIIAYTGEVLYSTDPRDVRH